MAKQKAAVEKKPPVSVIESRIKVLLAIQAQIDRKNLELKKLKEQYDEIERELLEAMQTEKLTTVATKQATAFISTRTFVSIESGDGFDKLMQFVFKHKAIDLLHRRVNSRAYLDRIENGEQIPGVIKADVPQVSIRRK